MKFNLERFKSAQRGSYEEALAEMRRGRKNGHWMWYIFPQVSGLGMSATSLYYGVRGLEEAKAYMADPVLGARLVEISNALLDIETDDPRAVFWYPDDMKLRSCMTLFAAAAPEEAVFKKVLQKFFGGRADDMTLDILGIDEI